MVAAAIEINLGTITLIVTALSLGGAAVGWIAWNIAKMWRRLNNETDVDKEKREKEDQERTNKLAKEETVVRETLLNRYKEMYELEKERSEREMREVKDKLDRVSKEQIELDNRYRQLRNDNDKLKEEYQKVISLNIEYQGAKARDTQEINRLKDELRKLQHQVNVMDPSKPEIR